MTLSTGSQRFVDGWNRRLELEGQGFVIVAFAARRDNYIFYLVRHPTRFKREYRIFAGCHRGWTMKQYRQHIRQRWYGRSKRAETKAILDLFQKHIQLSEWW